MKNRITIIFLAMIAGFNATPGFAKDTIFQNSSVNKKLDNKLKITINLDIKNKELEGGIRKALSLSKEKNLVAESRVELLYSISKKEINKVLIANGYYNANINSKLDKKNGLYAIDFNIVTGRPILIKTINLEVADKPNLIKEAFKALETKKLKQGNILLHQAYESTKADILSDLIDLGYLKAKFSEHVIKVDKNTNEAFIKLEITLGRRFYFGEIRFIADKYKQDILQCYIPFGKGAPYTAKNLEKLRTSLLDSRFFTKVRLYPKPNLDSNEYNVPVEVQVYEKLDNRYNGSIGYGTNSGYRGSLGWLHRHIGDTGMQFNAIGQFSKISRGVHGLLNIPSTDPDRTMYNLKAGVVEEKIDKRFSRKVEFIGERVQRQDNISRNLNVYYIDELYKAKPTDQKDRSRFLMPEYKYIWTKSTEDYYCCGQRFAFRIRGGLNKFVSATNVLQMEAEYKYIYKINDATRLILRAEVAGIFARKFKKIPVSMRYFTGGDNSVRGFAYKSIGPKELDNNGSKVVVGGKYKIVTNAEIERKIRDNTSIAAFIDAGKACNRFKDPLSVGAGAGVRFLSPLGSLRIDLASPVSKRLSSRKLRLHIGFSKDL